LYSSPGNPVVLAVYAAEVEGGALVAGDESDAARAFPLDDLPPLAFAHDRRIIEDWRRGVARVDAAATDAPDTEGEA
ncbi:MAG: hypothetical protein IRY97_11525, partial [Thermomicrobiaceae bacterium]|nr:hypothetical protein [Thermomicrobiaceae bacterium]